MYQLRNRFVTAAAIPACKSFLLSTPKHVREGALSDLATAFESNFEKKRIDPSHTFTVQYRSRKQQQAITIPHDAIKAITSEEQPSVSMYPTYLKNRIRISIRRRDMAAGAVPEFKYTCKLTLDKLGRFYLCVPCHVPACENQASSVNDNKNAWAAIDPGVRVFATVFSPTVGTAYRLADGDMGRITRLCQHLDRLWTLRQKRSVRRARARLQNRITHLVDEVHWKVIDFLCNNFQNILIPPFEVSGMVKRGGRRITKKCVRAMLTWRHYTFRRRLMDKATERGVAVYVMGEEYTTKTCTNCFHQHTTIGGNKMFKCRQCGVKVDRDLVGSRNIWLKNMQSSVMVQGTVALPRSSLESPHNSEDVLAHIPTSVNTR
jgi:putative transposase